MKKIRFISNPNSGVSFDPYLENTIGLSFDRNHYLVDYKLTEGVGHCKVLAKEAVDLGYDLVVAVGGDGTINEIASSLAHSKTALGIIPRGSGNGLSNHLKIPKNTLKALEVIKKGKIKEIDTARINEDRFVNISGWGFEASIAHKFDEYKDRGFWRYLKLVLKSFKESSSFTYLANGKEEKAWQITIANGSQYGNNVKIAPQADLADGFLEFLVLDKPNFIQAIKLAYAMYLGKPLPKARKVSIQNINLVLEKVAGHIDGEILKDQGPAYKIEIDPQSLRVIVP